MAATPAQATTAPTGDGAGLFGGSSSEKPAQVAPPTAAPTVSSTEKTDEPATEKSVDIATTGVADLSVTDKPTEEPKAVETTAPPAADPVHAAAAAPTPASTAPPTDTTLTTGPTWPETASDHPLTLLFAEIDALIQQAGHSEIYGIELNTATNAFHTKLILQKFLRANQNDLAKAKAQLIDTLQWRKEFDPVKAVGESFEKSRFEGLGYVLPVKGVPESGNEVDIVTFNIYGAVKDKKATFGDVEGFLRWRVGLMEKSVQKLNLKDAKTPIPNFGEGPDPYQGFQIHDYLQVSFLRQDPHVKAATKKTIEVLGRYYPETLSRKFFVNVPVVMGWVYQAMKLVVAKETVKKFTVLSYGNQLATELGPEIPKVYGGTTGELDEVAGKMNLV